MKNLLLLSIDKVIPKKTLKVLFLVIMTSTFLSYGQVNFNNNSLPNTQNNQYNSSLGVSNVVGIQSSPPFFSNGTDYGFAVGAFNEVLASYSFAFGSNNHVIGSKSIAIGQTNSISGNWSFSFGLNNNSVASHSYIIGSNCQANDQYTLAFGSNVRANSEGSMILGNAGNGNVFMQNNISNSLMVGFLSNIPTLFVGPSNGPGTVGKIGIGTTNTPSTLSSGSVNIDHYTLYVRGGILADEVRVRASWADYVFHDNYYLKSLIELENYINTNGHLPNVPSTEEVEAGGIEIGDITRIQQEKIEELTLYIIDLQKQINSLKVQLESINTK